MVASCFGVVMVWYDGVTVCTHIFDVVYTIIDFFLCGETIESTGWVLQNTFNSRRTYTFDDNHLCAVF